MSELYLDSYYMYCRVIACAAAGQVRERTATGHVSFRFLVRGARFYL